MPERPGLDKPVRRVVFVCCSAICCSFVSILSQFVTLAGVVAKVVGTLRGVGLKEIGCIRSRLRYFDFGFDGLNPYVD
jgi:hypothetical protein